MENGIPQGSVLSCILFNIAINDLTENIPRQIKIVLYADDITIFYRSANINTIQTRLQDTIKKLVNWSQENGLNFSPTKSEYMIFNKRKLPPNRFCLKFENNVHIREVKNKLFLGLYFDNKYNWKT